MSYREAYLAFATKEEIAALQTALSMAVARLDHIPGRPELESRWQAEDRRYEDLKQNQQNTNQSLIELTKTITTNSLEAQKQRLPSWFPWVFSAIMTLFVVGGQILSNHYWHN
jgi:hypothetical protein